LIHITSYDILPW